MESFRYFIALGVAEVLYIGLLTNGNSKDQ
jgi:hypothetical protein